MRENLQRKTEEEQETEDTQRPDLWQEATISDIDAIEEELNDGAVQNRNLTGGGGLQDNQSPGVRSYGNANERGVPGAFGSPEEFPDLTEGEVNDMLHKAESNEENPSGNRS